VILVYNRWFLIRTLESLIIPEVLGVAFLNKSHRFVTVNLSINSLLFEVISSKHPTLRSVQLAGSLTCSIKLIGLPLLRLLSALGFSFSV
jgi:hypothetical protein